MQEVRHIELQSTEEGLQEGRYIAVQSAKKKITCDVK